MRTVVVYRSPGEHARPVETFLHDYYRRTGRQLETLTPDSRDGAAFCQLYGIVEYPAVASVSYNGTLQYIKEGLPLPLIDEVSYYDKGD